VDWRQCAAVMPSCSGGGNVVVAWNHLITPFKFSRSGWSVVGSVSLAKGGTSK
jgi:hypothetical protein